MSGIGCCSPHAANHCREQVMVESSSAIPYRVFIALPIPGPVKDEIVRVQDELRNLLPRRCVRFTKREQFHLTLRFLGNVGSQRVEGLIHEIRAACREFSVLKLRAERIGCFPDLRFPRVVWVSVHDDAERLQTLQKSIDRAASRFTETKAEKDFTGHATIARLNGIKRPQAEALAKLAHGMSERFLGEWTVNEVEIIRSELSSSGSRYTTLATIRLEGMETTN